MSADDDDDADTVFLAEAAELQAGIERNPLDLAETPDDRDLIDALYRDLHRLKGSGAMFGHVELAHFLQGFETAFEALREPGGTAGDALIRVALQACDQIGALLADPAAASPGNAPILARLDAAAGAADTAPAEDGWRIRFALGPDALGLGTNVPALLQELEALAPGRVHVACDLSDLPPLEALSPAAPRMSWTVTIAAAIGRDAIDEVFVFVRDDLDLTIEPLGDAGPAAATGAQTEAAPDAPAGKGTRRGAVAADHATMRVATNRLDEIMDRVGELVIAASRLHDLSLDLGDPALMAVAEDKAAEQAAEQADEMLASLVPDIERTSEPVTEISRSNQEQATGAAQLNLAIQKLDKVTQQNTSASEELSATAEELACQAEQLQASASYFRVTDASAPSRGAPAVARRKPARAAPAIGFDFDPGKDDDGLDAQVIRDWKKESAT